MYSWMKYRRGAEACQARVDLVTVEMIKGRRVLTVETSRVVQRELVHDDAAPALHWVKLPLFRVVNGSLREEWNPGQ